MNNKGLSCSTVILIITITFQGCTQLGTQVAKVKSVMPGQKQQVNHIAAARAYEKKHEWVAARGEYEKYLKNNPQSVKTCHRLGIVCSHLGDTVAATRYFTQARQLEPNNSEVLNDFGFALFKRGQYQAAEKVFASALQNDANNERIMNNLALTVGHQGRFKESFSIFRNIMPAAEAHANLAYIHTQRGEGELALSEYDLALTADPNLERAGMAAAELAEMKNLSIARQVKKSDQQLATNKVEPKTQTKAKIQLEKQNTQPKKQKIQLARSKRPVQTKPSQVSEKTVPVIRESLISQASMKKERLIPSQRTIVPQPTQTKSKVQEEALEINSFRTLDELNQEENPVIIRISNEVSQKEAMFRSPRELSSTKK
ncbi:MAG: tetratricopeptide repeat protein [Planctomycetes bacterium]|nr:tetratricopeptide repeat protein [Planctomycetota bacterium]MCH9724649.1 tetratricopeptide repeat protein [Planctomycetota bacterium]MCH9777938.1 tetratricopeptide repeat protein [Planctomycetota bacterium]MCH9791246.1 tetratricopeptide repeat protein [Planctomycetota bacterium]MDF1746265.1 tetratricopeptide repeat protein [Gimesia sp.]